MGLGVALALAAPARAEEVTVFAASSLKTALDRIADDWQASTGNRVAVSYGGSPALARQILDGAPADLFLPAAVAWMDVLDAAGRIRTDTRRDLFGNTLVLVAHGGAAPPVAIEPGFDLAGLLGDGRLAMAMVDAVPAGQYGKAALTSLGVWPMVERNVAQTENARAALALVASGEAPFGIVFGSDAIAGAGSVTVVGTFPADSHPAIVYSGAVTTDAHTPAARALLDRLSSPEARAVLAAQGFVPLD